MSIFYTRIPVVCHGMLYAQTEEEKQAGSYPVSFYSTPLGNIARLDCHLAYAPGSKGNFRPGDIVTALVMFQYQIAASGGKYMGVDQGSRHVILGLHDFAYMFDTTLINANADIAGKDSSFTNRESSAGMVVGKAGDTHMFSPAYNKRSMYPYGNGTDQNSDVAHAQNFWKKIMNGNDEYTAVEHLGLTFGNTENDQAANVADPTGGKMYYAKRSFVPQTLDSLVQPKWVSTNEGTWCPFTGPNNDSAGLSKTKDILFSKIIHNFTKRITCFAGETGPEFLCLRVDNIIMPESVMPSSPRATPAVPGPACFYLAISDAGEINMMCHDDAGVPTVSLTTKKDGSVELKSSGTINFVGNFTVNGKKVLTEDFAAFFESHQADLTNTLALGSPAPMSPGAIADFTKGKAPAKFMTDVAAPIVIPPNSKLLSSI